ncbi:CheR family methyltransferase [Salimicrobium salexigens]|uniref:protein-glutamate O-methyltransferase n=1 Tax=Salimicrobium salexigens TaxID=908941 RepID=A0ABY1KKF8_9BACI|nr:CheR family methyltransferase [Salimicrobium salexigens]SIS45421.1 two-component system, chemotaxis family, CheB/CheR fusion protein [Salimicrobium salexigens]
MSHTEEKYYIGIGASAGGLESLERFFKTMPNDTGLTFIIIQHLSPDFESHMDDLLRRYTSMNIHVAEDMMATEPNSVYLIPPRKNLSIYHGTLHLSEQTERKHLNLPIDLFFKSLAEDQGRNSIGVILSGTGSDGTLGVRALKDADGMVIAEDETTAKFDGMPRSAISTGLIDYILPPDDMAEEIINYVTHPADPVNRSLQTSDGKSMLSRINRIMRSHSKIDFDNYKETTMIRRINRRVKLNRLQTLEEYAEHLSNSEKERNILQQELFIGVTGFFRDKEAFDSLTENVLPKLDYNKEALRIWSAGCSTGEEVYSLAILLCEYMEKNNLQTGLKIFATDIDDKALETAGNGVYPESLMADVPPELVAKYFIKEEEGYRIANSIRKMVVFAKHNLVNDPPFSRLDLLVCRNLFIYLKSETQQYILNKFYYSLLKNGYLFLGTSETLGDLTKAYRSIDNKWKIYKPREDYRPDHPSGISLYSDKGPEIEKNTQPAKSVAQNVNLENVLQKAVSSISPPSIIIDGNDQIIHVVNDMSDYLRPQPGKFSNNFNTNMSRELSLFVNNILRRLKAERTHVRLNNIMNGAGEETSLSLSGHIIEMKYQFFYFISFIEATEVKVKNSEEVDVSDQMKERVRYLESELQLAREGLQATVEELETSNEELQTSNEELTASNEELQSTNEELQSVNEEIYTVNNEYQEKIEELKKANNDLNNLLNNTEIGALYLDEMLCIRRITPLMKEVSNVRDEDIGRPISHISVMSEYPEVVDDVYEVLDSLIKKEKEIEDNKGRHWFVRIRPYRTEYNSVNGIIVTLVEITNLKKERSKVMETKEKFEQVLEISNMGWWEFNGRADHFDVSPSFLQNCGYGKEDFPTTLNEVSRYFKTNDIKVAFEKMLSGKKKSINLFASYQCEDGSFIPVHFLGRVLEKDHDEDPLRIGGTIIDISNYMKQGD